MDYEVITDHDLDSKGSIALESFSAVITSTHPEYYSTSMLDGIETYIHQGGKLLYLGGNGFYWVTETRPDEPHCIEIRRLNTGIRAWEGRPGEGYLITTGQKSGLWRDRGRPPQKIVGVGFTTEGMDVSQPFTRLSDSYDPEMAWIFEGLQDDELIGDFGLGRGGASGLEMDRYDLALGTPPHTRLLCASFGHSDAYPLVPEDIMMMLPGYGGTQNPLVRGDVTYFTTAKGGAVFSAGSIAWSQALPANGGDNNVATITRNILRAFVDTHKQAHSSA
jgi:N,N-dimethylformamidase